MQAGGRVRRRIAGINISNSSTSPLTIDCAGLISIEQRISRQEKLSSSDDYDVLLLDLFTKNSPTARLQAGGCRSLTAVEFESPPPVASVVGTCVRAVTTGFPRVNRIGMVGYTVVLP